MFTSMDKLMMHFLGDVTVTFSQPYNTTKVERDLFSLPGVVGVEGWGGAAGEIWDETDEAVADLSIIAPPQDTQLLNPQLLAGRWLLSGEQKALVISDSIFRYDNFEQGIPIGVVENIFEFQDALVRIRAEADVVIPMHDNDVLVRYPDGAIAE